MNFKLYQIALVDFDFRISQTIEDISAENLVVSKLMRMSHARCHRRSSGRLPVRPLPAELRNPGAGEKKTSKLKKLFWDLVLPYLCDLFVCSFAPFFHVVVLLISEPLAVDFKLPR